MNYLRKPPKRHGKYFVYIIRCKDGTFYTGYTNNLENRIKLHNSGKGAKYLRGKTPAKLVYSREYNYYKNAVVAERTIKCYSRDKKEKLVKGEITPVLNRNFIAPGFSSKRKKKKETPHGSKKI